MGAAKYVKVQTVGKSVGKQTVDIIEGRFAVDVCH